MKTTSVVTMALIAVCVLGVDAGEPKTSAPARRPVSATNTSTKAQAARYNSVKTASSRFDEEFQSVPTTPQEIKCVLARMVVQSATQAEFRRFHDLLIGGNFTYLVSSVMVARAENPHDHAISRCLYGNDLAVCTMNNVDKSPLVIAELEAALGEAIKTGIDQEHSLLVPAVVLALGGNYVYRAHDVDKSWKLYKECESIVKKEEGIRADYLGNIASSLMYGNNRPNMSSETFTQMKTYVDQMLLDTRLSHREKYQCEQLRKALSSLSDGDLKKQDQAKKAQ